MTLQEIFKQLTYGELSQISIGGVENGQINETNFDQILANFFIETLPVYSK